MFAQVTSLCSALLDDNGSAGEYSLCTARRSPATLFRVLFVDLVSLFPEIHNWLANLIAPGDLTV